MHKISFIFNKKVTILIDQFSNVDMPFYINDEEERKGIQNFDN
jgi:hypothetical protein